MVCPFVSEVEAIFISLRSDHRCMALADVKKCECLQWPEDSFANHLPQDFSGWELLVVVSSRWLTACISLHSISSMISSISYRFIKLDYPLLLFSLVMLNISSLVITNEVVITNRLTLYVSYAPLKKHTSYISLTAIPKKVWQEL